MRISSCFSLVAILGLGLGCGSDSNGGGAGGGSGLGGTGNPGAGGTGNPGAGGSGNPGAGGSGNPGAGGSSGGASVFACDYANYSGTGFHWCWTWDASNLPSAAQALSAYQAACTQGMGTAVAACSTTGAVGKCTFTSTTGAYTVTQSIFYYAPFDRTAAMAACTANNTGGVTATWTAL